MVEDSGLLRELLRNKQLNNWADNKDCAKNNSSCLSPYDFVALPDDTSGDH